MPIISTQDFYRPMNASISRARQLAQAKGMRDDDLDYQRRQQDLRAGDQALRIGDAKFTEDRRRFDTRQSQFDGLMKMLFGAGGEGGGGGMNALRRMGGGGPGMAPADDGIDRLAINNSLAAYLQGRM